MTVRELIKRRPDLVEWVPYAGNRRKQECAIKTKDGQEHQWAYPNGDVFFLAGGEGAIREEDVTHFRFSPVAYGAPAFDSEEEYRLWVDELCSENSAIPENS